MYALPDPSLSCELIDVIRLTYGERVVVRPVLPQDRKLMVAFFHDLSVDSRCNRFMHPLNEPSSELGDDTRARPLSESVSQTCHRRHLFLMASRLAIPDFASRCAMVC